jgi:hypothetical protein|tara:strand:- start:1435 stop:1638 length:204 start_codon:yes stop_codon:yes gene_type:complete
MGKKDEYGNRSTKKDKKKNTFKKFGKATSRGVRFAEEQKANTLEKKIKSTEKQLSKKDKKRMKYFKA